MMLDVQNLSAWYSKNKLILKNISFELKPGKLTVLLGKNGCGKSTVFACVNREIKYTGNISIASENISKMASVERAKKIAILPQYLEKVHITVNELVMFGRSPYIGFGRRPCELDRKIVDKCMHITGISDLSDSFVDEISGGERQKSYLAMVLAQETPIIMLDEPTTYMDASVKAEFMKLIKSIQKENGKTVLIVTHDLESAIKYADEVIILDSGEVVFSGTVQECLKKTIIEQVFDVKQKILYEENNTRYVVFEKEDV